MVENLHGARSGPCNYGPLALILAPTRELAAQIDEVFKKICRPFGLRTALLIGGVPLHRQFSLLKARPQIIIATPGRLEDHLRQRTLRLHTVNTLVLDEADRMLDMGFAPSIRRIASVVPKERQTLLFSATFPKEIEQLAGELLRNPEKIEISEAGTAAENVSQELWVIEHAEKVNILEKILGEKSGPVLVFTRTRHGARKLAKAICQMDYFAAEIHADRTLAQRTDALAGFKSGKYAILVATDIASRGIDVRNISMVVNYDLPDQPEDYIHRIGRTGRAGASGRSITFATPQQKKELFAVEKILKHHIPLSVHSPLDIVRRQETGRPGAIRRGTNFRQRVERPVTERFFESEVAAVRSISRNPEERKSSVASDKPRGNRTPNQLDQRNRHRSGNPSVHPRSSRHLQSKSAPSNGGGERTTRSISASSGNGGLSKAAYVHQPRKDKPRGFEGKILAGLVAPRPTGRVQTDRDGSKRNRPR